jgi:hypothetical protein
MLSISMVWHPAVIRCKDVLYIPEVGKNLLSTYCLGKRGYQFVDVAANSG